MGSGEGLVVVRDGRRDMEGQTVDQPNFQWRVIWVDC